MKFEGEQFLHRKDSTLHVSEPVEHEQERRMLAGEETHQKPTEKLADWMQVLNRTHTGHRDDPRVLERIKEHYYKDYVIKPEDIPEGYYDNQRRLAREQGHGDIEMTDDMRRDLAEVLVADQQSTLDIWLEYFTSPDADSFPVWAKYWTFTGMVKLASYDKEKHAFGKRDKGTVAPFPDLNREAAAYVIDAIAKKAKKERVTAAVDDPEFQQLLDGANFAKLYAFAIEKVTPASQEQLTSTAGEWVKYDQNSDHMPLVRSLEGHGTGWCTAGESTAETQLKGGDFFVYYSLDTDGNPTIPRAAIRMQEGKIAEVRGVAAEQNLDSTIAPVVEAKLKEFPDGVAYEKKTTDMRVLTAIEQTVQAGKELTTAQLRLLYEIDAQIEGFGYQRDPRIAELRSYRNPQEDMPTVFECSPDQIAHNATEITADTKAYVGLLVPGIFQMLPEGIEHMYTSFPENPIRQDMVEIGGTSREELIHQLEEKGIKISDYARDMLNSVDFTTSKETEDANLVRLAVESLGFPHGATTEQIYQRANELGLELCPAEVGPHYRLKYADQPMGDYFRIGMKQITDRYGNPRVFSLGRRVDGLWLNEDWAGPDDRCYPNYRIVFRFRKSKKEA